MKDEIPYVNAVLKISDLVFINHKQTQREILC